MMMRSEVLLNKLVAERICAVSKPIKRSVLEKIQYWFKGRIYRIKDFISYIGEYNDIG